MPKPNHRLVRVYADEVCPVIFAKPVEKVGAFGAFYDLPEHLFQRVQQMHREIEATNKAMEEWLDANEDSRLPPEPANAE